MNLKEYLKNNHIPKKEFAFDLGIHFSHLDHIISGRRTPSLPLALKIQRLTNGAVRPEDFQKAPASSSLGLLS